MRPGASPCPVDDSNNPIVGRIGPRAVTRLCGAGIWVAVWQFSPATEGFLYTSGVGHIRFWKMASTFTGLKLQGEIGKFGNIEITDVSGNPKTENKQTQPSYRH